MSDQNIILPSKPRVISEEDMRGVYEIDSLYPGYGYTIGNSLRRIILSSLPGAAITIVKIDNVAHEFSTIEGVKEDVVLLLLNLKKVRFKLNTEEPQEVMLTVKGAKTVTAADIKTTGQVEVLNPEQYICEMTSKSAEISISLRIEKGLGFVPKEQHQKAKVEIGTIALDAIFSPIRRVNYEVEDMRVGDKTNFNRLRILIETDGTLTPRFALESAIKIMVEQLQAMLDFRVETPGFGGSIDASDVLDEESASTDSPERKEELAEIMKTRLDTLELSTRVMNALTNANIRTLGGLVRKRKEDLLDIEGMGEKGVQELKRLLSNYGITLK
jgi:DNA-directed RNA polymerase subunit alpha